MYFIKNHLPRIAVTILFFFFGGGFASWASRIPTIKSNLQVSDSDWGLVLLYLSIGTLITLPFAGNLIYKLGSKKSTLLFIILYLLFLIGIGFWDTLWQLKLNLIAFGAMGNLTNIAINTQAVNVSHAYKGQITGSFHGFWSIGGFIASWLGAFMISNSTPPLPHFIIYSSIGIIISLALFKFLVPIDYYPEKNEEKTKNKFQFPDKSLIILGILALFAMISEGSMTDWSSEYMKSIVKPPKEYIGYGLTAYMSTMSVGRFISDLTVRRFGPNKTLKISGVLIFLGLSITVFYPNFIMTIISFMIVGLGISAIVPLVYTLAGKSKTIATGKALTIVTSIGFIGFFLGPPCIGFIAEKFTLRIAYAIISIFGIGIVFLSSFISKD